MVKIKHKVKHSAHRVKRKAPLIKRRPRPKLAAEPKKKLVGLIDHYYNKIGVAVVDVAQPIKKGDLLSVESAETAFKQKAVSMEVDHKKIQAAKKGQSVGLKVKQPVRERFQVYKFI